MTLEEILKAIDTLSDEDKAKLKSKVQDVEKAEDEREIDELKEEVSEDVPEEEFEEKTVEEESEEPAMEKGEAVKEETAPEQPDVAEEPMTEENADEVVEDEGEKTVTDESVEENIAEMVHGMADRLAQMEEQMNSLLEVKAKLEEMAQRKDKAFGYESKIPGAKKDYSSMTAGELKNELAVNI